MASESKNEETMDILSTVKQPEDKRSFIFESNAERSLQVNSRLGLFPPAVVKEIEKEYNVIYVFGQPSVIKGEKKVVLGKDDNNVYVILCHGLRETAVEKIANPKFTLPTWYIFNNNYEKVDPDKEPATVCCFVFVVGKCYCFLLFCCVGIVKAD